MQLKLWVLRLALGAILFGGVLACQTTDRFLAQAEPTPTRTRTVRPTFTPIPPPTNTPVPPSPTVPPPPPPTSTRAPTARPAPSRTPTKPPAPQATAVPQPTTPRYQYSVASTRCEHSGGSWLKGVVYADRNDPNSGMPGVKVVFGGSGGEVYGGPRTTEYDGVFDFTLTPDGGGAKIGTFYLWVVDNTGNRISDMAGPIRIDGKPAPDGCWAGWAFFVKNF